MRYVSRNDTKRIEAEGASRAVDPNRLEATRGRQPEDLRALAKVIQVWSSLKWQRVGLAHDGPNLASKPGTGRDLQGRDGRLISGRADEYCGVYAWRN